MFAKSALRQQVLKEGWQLSVAPHTPDRVETRRDAVQPEGLLLRRFCRPEGFRQHRFSSKGLTGIGLINREADDGLGIFGREFKQHAHPPAMQLDDKDGNIHQCDV